MSDSDSDQGYESASESLNNEPIGPQIILNIPNELVLGQEQNRWRHFCECMAECLALFCLAFIIHL